MGCWGAGNFDSDEAGDFAGALCRDLLARAERACASGDATSVDVVAMPCLEAVLGLAARTHVALDAARLAAMERAALGAFDAAVAADRMGDGHFNLRRRATIGRTFALLARLASADDAPSARDARLAVLAAARQALLATAEARRQVDRRWRRTGPAPRPGKGAR